ncbi:MAG: phosphonate C-P lyase system protein PhnH [Halothiobacillaceae bacterium]|nr:phosphonate C-P lyase system protein PhnH [Halothiobacillaceae bacterium]
MLLEAIFNPNLQQAVFRAMLHAQSYPGLTVALPEAIDGQDTHRALLSALLDAEVSLADPDALLSDETDWPFLEARRASVEQADFILADGARPQVLKPRLGTLDEPEQSATLVLRLSATENAPQTSLHLSGPGIREPRSLSVNGLHPDWIQQRNGWVTSFPLGVDLILAGTMGLIALPRTTCVEIK